MTSQTTNTGKPDDKQQEKRDRPADPGLLEKTAQLIDPPGREVSDDELIDPGSNVPGSGRARPVQKPPAGR
jgi:hypothetical protein